MVRLKIVFESVLGSDLTFFLGTIEVRTKTGALGIVNSVVHPGIVRNLFIDKSTLYIDR